MALIALDGAWLDVNQSLCDMLGYSSEELSRLRLQDIMHPDDLELHLSNLQALLTGSMDRSQRDGRFVHKRGRSTWMTVTGAPVRDDQGLLLYFSAQIQDISDRKRAESALQTIAVEQTATLEATQHRAFHDALTDLPNRTLLADRLEQSVLAARPQRASFALLFLDLDRFKQVNDTLGHAAGDLLLQQVAHQLCEVLRESDTIARMGGDEFAVVLPLVDEDGAHLVADKIVHALEEPFSVEGAGVHVRASIGLALYPEHGETADTLMRHADVAMYVAKRGRLGCATYSPEQDANTPSRLALAAELGTALEEDQLILHYQPKIDLRSGLLTGVEALIRWQHPQHGLIPPSEFVPLAEQAGFMTPLSRWVIAAALKQCRAWQDRGLSLRIAVNLSAINLQEDHLATYVSDQAGSFVKRPCATAYPFLLPTPPQSPSTASHSQASGKQVHATDWKNGPRLFEPRLQVLVLW